MLLVGKKKKSCILFGYKSGLDPLIHNVGYLGRMTWSRMWTLDLFLITSLGSVFIGLNLFNSF